jgi:succinoglycan biosynthesis transport protein ExoP
VELRRYLVVFRNHLLLIVAALVVALAVGWVTAPRAKLYQAQASVYVGPNSISTAPDVLNNPLVAAQQIITTYSKMIVSRPVIEDAVVRAGGIRPVSTASAESTAAQITFTQLIVLKVTDRDPAVAAALANAEVAAFQGKAAGFSTGSGVPTFPVYPFESAVVPSQPLSNGLRSRLITAGLFGLVIGAAAALLVDHLDLTIRAAADATRRLDLPVLGAIPVQRQRA